MNNAWEEIEQAKPSGRGGRVFSRSSAMNNAIVEAKSGFTFGALFC